MNLLLLLLYRAWSSVLRKLRAMAEARSRNNVAAGAVQVAVQVYTFHSFLHPEIHLIKFRQRQAVTFCSLHGLVQSSTAVSYLLSLW